MRSVADERGLSECGRQQRRVEGQHRLAYVCWLGLGFGLPQNAPDVSRPLLSNCSHWLINLTVCN